MTILEKYMNEGWAIWPCSQAEHRELLAELYLLGFKWHNPFSDNQTYVENMYIELRFGSLTKGHLMTSWDYDSMKVIKWAHLKDKTSMPPFVY